MNKNTTIALFGSVFVGAAILLALTGVNPVAQVVASTTSISDSSTGIFGHITLTVTDNETGDITSYRQTDNTIMRTGSDCFVVRMFGTTSGTEACANETNDFKFIEIGIGGNAGSTGTCSGQPASTNSTLGNNLAIGDDSDLIKVLATSIVAGQASGSGATATLSVAFTPSGGSHDVNEALLSNVVTADTGDDIGNQCFAPITITSSDTLTVEWVITIGGA